MKYNKVIKKTIFSKYYKQLVVAIFATGIIFQFGFALKNNLTFDEAAAWHTTKESFQNILWGKYNHVGDMPLFYLTSRLYMSLIDRNEFLTRLPLIFFNTVTFGLYLLVVNKIKITREYKLVTLSLFWLSPEISHVIFRSYSYTILFQILYIYILLLCIEKTSFLREVILSFSFLLALFSGFSSIYLLPATFFYLLISNKKRHLLKRLAIFLAPPAIIFAIWLLNYSHQPDFHLAQHNYVNYRNRNVLGSFIEMGQNWLGISPWWMWTDNLSLKEQFINNITKTYSLIMYMAIILYLIIHNTYFWITKKGNEIVNFASAFLLFPLCSAIIFSALFFNVIAHRLLLAELFMLPLAFSLMVSYLLKSSPRFVGVFLCGTVILTMIVTNVVNLNKNYVSFTTLYSRIAEFKPSNKDCVVISSYITIDLIRYYDNKYGKNILNGANELPMSNFVPSTLEQAHQTLQTKKCSKVFYLRWYDDKDGSAINRVVTDNVQNYKKVSDTQVSTTKTIGSLIIYEVNTTKN